MREGWTYKKLGEVCSFIGGGTPSKSVSKYYCGNIPWATVRDMSNFKLDFTELKITQEAVDNSATNVLPKGMIVISTHVGLGKICELMQDTAINQDLKGADLDTEVIDKYYFCYWYKSQNDLILSNATGATVKGVTLKFVQGMDVALPPLTTQQQIVSELDLLTHILDQKRQQLKEYDALAESIFYDMFGDPNNNDKKWATKAFSSCCKNCDSQRKPITSKDRVEGNIPYYGASGIVDYVKDYIFDGDYLLISEDGANLLMRSTPIAFLIKGKNWVNNHAHVVKFEHIEEQIFMEYFFNLLDLKDLITGCAQPKLTQGALNKILVFDIPFALQRSFAAKIQSIEHQKQLLKESIKETEMLFQSRMDYWFNG